MKIVGIIYGLFLPLVPVLAMDDSYSTDEENEQFRVGQSIQRSHTPCDDLEYGEMIYANMQKLEDAKNNVLVNSPLVDYIACNLQVSSSELSQQKIHLGNILKSVEVCIDFGMENILRILKEIQEKAMYTSDDCGLRQAQQRPIRDCLTQLHLTAEALDIDFTQQCDNLLIEYESRKILTAKKDSVRNEDFTKIKRKVKKRSKSIFFFIDGYMATEILKVAHTFFQVITPQNRQAYLESDIVKKLQNKRLINEDVKIDTAVSWLEKKRHIFNLEHALRMIAETDNKASEAGLIKDQVNKNTHKHLVNFYLDSHMLLNYLFENAREEALDLPTLIKNTISFQNYFSSLQNSYQKNHPELFIEGSNSKTTLEASFIQSLQMLYKQHLKASESLFEETIKTKENLNDVQILNTQFLAITDELYTKFTDHYKTILTCSFIDGLYLKTLNSYFTSVLINIEARYKSRGTLNQALSSMGWRSPLTKVLLSQIEGLYRQDYPGLFDKSFSKAADLEERLKTLKATMSEVDNNGYDQAFNTVTSTISGLNPFSWWSGASRT